MGKNDLYNDMWLKVELPTALKEKDTNCSALNYFISFIGIASPSPEMQQLFVTAQCCGARGEGGSSSMVTRGLWAGRMQQSVLEFGWGSDSNIL